MEGRGLYATVSVPTSLLALVVGVGDFAGLTWPLTGVAVLAAVGKGVSVEEVGAVMWMGSWGGVEVELVVVFSLLSLQRKKKS